MNLEIAHESPHLQALLKASLHAPAEALFLRPQKGIRGELVRLGYHLAAVLDPDLREKMEWKKSAKLCTQLALAIEDLHTGSLIIDDIQDNSTCRRGGPTVHQIYGTPLALNAGNWLYFRAYQLMGELPADSETKLSLLNMTTQTLLAAHQGQAVDLATDILQVPAQSRATICWKSLELKTGRLMALAMGLGAVLAQAQPVHLAQIQTWGCELGVLLQMFDDLGSLRRKNRTPKHLEDLILHRPSYIWAYASEHLSRDNLSKFENCVRALPDTAALDQFDDSLNFRKNAWLSARTALKCWLATLPQNDSCAESLASANPIQGLRDLGEKLSYAYE